MSKMDKSCGKTSQTVPENKKIRQPGVPQSGEILKTVRGGDVNSLGELLAREHKKRMPGATASRINEENTARFLDQPGIDRELIEQIMKIAADNGLVPDWVLIRALKVYVCEYQRTGRL